MKKVTGVDFSHFHFLIFFLIILTGDPLLAQQPASVPDNRLTVRDKIARAFIAGNFKIDKLTFMNTTPDKNYPYWIKGIHRYTAMNEGWGACDPPEPPRTFLVTGISKVFLTMPEALSSIHYVPKNTRDALEAAVMIASMSSPAQAAVILSNKTTIKGIPQDVVSKYTLTPSVTENNGHFTIILYSYVSYNTRNKFNRGHHSLWKHAVLFDGGRFSEKITILWEKSE